MERHIISLLLIFLLANTLSACGKNAEPEKTPYIKVENNELNKSLFTEDPNSFTVTLTFLNTTDIDIGMLSIIDPKANEAIQIAPIDSQNYISMEANWPNYENELRWALYNQDGELCIEGTSNLTGITESATIVLGGEGNVTSIDVQVN